MPAVPFTAHPLYGDYRPALATIQSAACRATASIDGRSSSPTSRWPPAPGPNRTARNPDAVDERLDQRARARVAVAGRSRSLPRSRHSRVGPDCVATGHRQGKAAEHPVRCEGHHRNHGAGDGIRIADLQRAYRDVRRGDRSPVARAWRRAVWQDPHHRVCVSNAIADPQSAEPESHARRQFERVGRGGCGRHGAVCDWDADRRIHDPAGVVLRRHRIQANLRRPVERGRAAAGHEPGYHRLLHSHTADDMLLLWWDAIGQPTGRDETITFGIPSLYPMSKLPWPRRCKNRSAACVAPASKSPGSTCG